MPDLVNIEKTPISPEQSVESAEQKTAPEKSPEQFTEKKAEQDASAQSVVLPDDSDSQDKTKISTSTVTLRKVESILSRDMDKVFLSMDAATQQKFKIKVKLEDLKNPEIKEFFINGRKWSQKKF